MASEILLTAQQLTVQRGHRTLLSNINITLSSGQFMALVGENGCGKSTLLAMLSGLEPLVQGQIHFKGKTLAHWPVKSLASQRAVMHQLPAVPFGFLVEEILLLGRTLITESRQQSIRHLIEVSRWLDIEHLLARNVQTLSGGERQRVFVAKALLQLKDTHPAQPGFEGKVLLLDEPTSALDFRHQKQLMQLLSALTGAGLSTVCISHDINLVSPYCHQLMLLGEETCIACGCPNKVLSQANLRRCLKTQVQLIHRDDQTRFVSH